MRHVKRLKAANFNGDIIITDPCYIVIDNLERDDWEKCDYGSNMEVLGLHNFIANSTIYGDWSCTTFTKGDHKILGRFCADAGQVGVFNLTEVLKYNSKFDYHISRPWTTTLIKNFKGRVWIEKIWNDEDIHDWFTCVKVRGKGINTATGEELEFFTSQTGV